MGSFEKLGILVIVVIIVMILAVAIYQWGATGVEPGIETLPVLTGEPPPLFVDYDNPPQERREAEPPPKQAAADAWPGGIPKRHTIKRDDIVWKLVVQRWRLKDSFIQAIQKANPELNMRRLMPGDTLVIPDPAPHKAGKKSAKPPPRSRLYEIQEGDSLEAIARRHLGRGSRWREILALNPGLDPNNLQLGVKIRVPVK